LQNNILLELVQRLQLVRTVSETMDGYL
jgi:hypothetical protein